MNQVDETDQEIGEDDGEDTSESTLSSDIEEDSLDNQQEVLCLGQTHRDRLLRTIRIPLPKKRSCANTVIARPALPNSGNLPASMVPPLLKRRKSSLLNKLSESDFTPSA